MRDFTAAQADDLYELISEAPGNPRSSPADRAPADSYPLYPNPVVAGSLLNRVVDAGRQVVINGPSYRPRRRPGRVLPTDTTSTSSSTSRSITTQTSVVRNRASTELAQPRRLPP